MAIFRKADLARHLHELSSRHAALKAAVEGTEPNPNIFEFYAHDPQEYSDSFVEVDITSVDYALQDFRTSLTQLGKLKSLQAKKLKNG